MDNESIDFVLTWVDGSDPAWLAERSKYEQPGSGMASGGANATCRYRDFGLLRYWFRAAEQFAPWFHRLYFVTCGQKPDWLKESHPKLRLVHHTDYIPAAHLPTFHSNTIELNLHRIPELSEHFVMFNDDVFLLRPTSPDFFFRNGCPRLPCDLGIPRWFGYSNISRVVLNNSGVLRRSLDVERLIWKHIWKFVDIRSLGLARAMKNLVSFAVNRIWIPSTFGHMTMPHLKSTLEELWRVQPDILERVSRSRFRTDECINHWLACAWNMVTGKFYPIHEQSLGEFTALNEKNLARVCEMIRRQSKPVICLNDDGSTQDVEACSQEAAHAFEAILPQKSSFEK
ncbi:MAG: Stealth CR1 domain-containing protein [Victivallales bacterium]|nr:Stealth CR1 domain-containing protein [Victivallales bacterium]